MPKIVKQTLYWSWQVVEMLFELIFQYLYTIALEFWFLTIILIFLLLAWHYNLL